MKYVKIFIFITIVAFNTPTYATGGKRVPPVAPSDYEKSLLETIIDVFTFE